METFVLLTLIDIPDTDNIVIYKSSTPINQHKMANITRHRADWSDLSEWYFQMV